MAAIFICHPFAGDPAGNIERVRRVARELALAGHVPLAAHLLLPPILNEETERPLAVQICLQLVGLADVVQVFGETPTTGMQAEIKYARNLGIPVVRGELP